MKRVHFSDGMKPLTADMNKLHLNTEDAIAELLGAVGGSSDKLLFESEEPTASVDGTTGLLTIDVPAQHFAISGAISSIPETQYVLDVSGTDAKVAIYFVVNKLGVEDQRNFISLDNTTQLIIQQDLTTVVEYQDNPRVEFIATTDGTIPEAPPMGAGDLGYVLLGTYDWIDATDTLTFTGNIADAFTLPANVQQALSTHGSQHLPGGNDPIPVSALGNVSGGSSAGLAPNGCLRAALGSIQGIVAADDSTFIDIVDSGNNSISGNDITEKVTTIGINVNESLTTDANNALGLNFLSGSARAGFSARPARSDHVHALIETGIISQTIVITLPPDQSINGTIIGPYTISSVSSGGAGTVDVSRIVSVNLSWIPPGVSGTNFGIACGWNVYSANGIKTVGCRPIVTGQTTFEVEIGSEGTAYLTQSTINKINTLVTPSWLLGPNAYGGKLKVDIVAIRLGAHTDTVATVTI